MNILLFGGSFDPPHLGHLIVIHQALELVPHLDQLWLLPAYQHSFGKHLTPASHRLAMCQLLIDELKSSHQKSPLKLSSFEIDHQSSGSTYETLQLLKQSHPSHSFSFLMGSDQLSLFHTWEHHQQLLQQMPFFVYPRRTQLEALPYPHMTLLQSPTQVITTISSSLIKQRLLQGQSVNHLLPASIASYIQTHQLYPV